jgi:IclR family acetate operon transcriptional repressor
MSKNPPESDRRARGRPRDWHDKTAQNTIKSLDRAIALLQRLGEMGGATLSELSDDRGQSPATVYRVMVTLEGRGLVEFDENSQIWNVGAGAYLIGANFLRRTGLVERARPFLRALMAETGETANLGIERGGEVLFVNQVETHSNIRAFFPPGSMSEMHASGIGKALLAFMPEDRRAAVLKTLALTRYTPHTLTTISELDQDMKASRTRGYAVDADEKTLGMRCIAAPVFDANGEAVAGLSVSGPSSRISDDQISDLGNKVRSAARDLSLALGAKMV